MELAQFYQLIKSGKKTLAMSVMFFVLFAMAFTFLRPLEFRAQSRLLIIQNSQEGTDPFVAAKANEYLGGVLTKIVTSNSFLDEVLASGLNIDMAYFSSDQQKRAKVWEDMVMARSFGDLGVIEISVFHPDKFQAEQVAQAIDLTLRNKSNSYLSTGDKVEIRVIDQPIVSKWPVRPNIVLNMILGPVIGLIFGLFYLYLFGKVSVQVEAFQPPVQQYSAPQQVVQPMPEPVQQPATVPVATMTEPPQQMAIAPQGIEPVVAAAEPQQPAVPTAVATPTAQTPVRPPANNDFDLDDILNQGNISNLL